MRKIRNKPAGKTMRRARSGPVTITITSKFDELKRLREKVNWDVENDRIQLLRQIYDLISRWQERLPNFRAIFSDDEMDWLLIESASDRREEEDQEWSDRKRFIEFVEHSGYKVKPVLGENGKPQRRRTTALHHAAKSELRDWKDLMSALFNIYDDCEVNYVDRTGFAHFHAACKFGCKKVVEKFLDAGQDPNCLWRATGDSPLRLALGNGHEDVVRVLLNRGANPNLANSDGLTPLHVLSTARRDDVARMIRMLFEHAKKPLNVNAKYRGTVPLHLAVSLGKVDVAKILLDNGADPNWKNHDGQNAVHVAVVHQQYHRHNVVDEFFEIVREKRLKVQINVEDKQGLTPLQWAVASLMPDVVRVLLAHGADLSRFVFPNSKYFGVNLASWHEESRWNFELRQASGALGVVQCLEEKGYQLSRNSAIRIMTFIIQRVNLAKPSFIEDRWYEKQEFARRARKIFTRPGLTLHDLVTRGAEVEERPEHYYEIACSELISLLPRGQDAACGPHLCHKLSIGFFRQWAVLPLIKLTRHLNMPAELCEMIVNGLSQGELYGLCLAAASKNPRNELFFRL